VTIFFDASGLYAVFDRDDANHSRAKIAWAEWLREGAELLTNSWWKRLRCFSTGWASAPFARSTRK
jgi:hypothetical protein